MIGASVEVFGKALRIDGGGGDDQLQVRALGQQLLQPAEQEVDIEAALVGLVDDQRVVFVQIAVVLDLGQQHAVGHQLDRRARLHPVVETHLVADGSTQLGAEFLRHPARQAARGDAPRLGVADAPKDAPTQPQARVQTDLGQLGGLAGAGLAAEHDDLMVADQRGHLVAALADRQLRRVFDRAGCRRGAARPPHGRRRWIRPLARDLDPPAARRARAAAARVVAVPVRPDLGSDNRPDQDPGSRSGWVAMSRPGAVRMGLGKVPSLTWCLLVVGTIRPRLSGGGSTRTDERRYRRTAGFSKPNRQT